MNEKRENYRSNVSVSLKLQHESFGTLDVNSRDVSVGGVYALVDQVAELPAAGSIINVQVLNSLAIQSEIDAEVVRVEDGGFGLRFLYPDYDEQRRH